MSELSGKEHGRRYLKVEDLRRLRHMLFVSRRRVEGAYAGRHASPQRGHSVEFNDYRQYIPGDEIGDIDWKVYGRSDRLFVKLFEHQTDMTVSLLIDASASMGYAGAGVGPPAERGRSWLARLSLPEVRRAAAPRPEVRSKYDQACLLAAAVAFLVTQQQDRVAAGFAQGGLTRAQPPGGSPAHLRRVLMAMEEVRPAGMARLADAIRQAAATAKRRGLLLVFSDLYEDREAILPALGSWLHRGGEAAVFHVLHPDELRLPDVGSGVFVDAETGRRVRLDTDDARRDYERRLAEFLDGWRTACRARGIAFRRVLTTDSYADALRDYLARAVNKT